jgi:transcriptional regulator with GAF, ATPase, and Fis domain
MLAAHGDKRVSADAWRELTAYSWPGNLRELHDAVARAVKRGGDVLEPRDFFPGTRRELAIADEVEKSPRSTLVDRRWRRSSRPRGLEEQDAE